MPFSAAKLGTVIATAAVAMTSAESLDFKRVHLVDQGPTNFLFRGNMPTNSTGFAYDELMSFLQNRSIGEGNGTVLPADTKLMVLSLNNDFDGDDFKVNKRNET